MRHGMGMMVQMIVFCLGGVVLAIAAVAFGFGFGAVAPFLLFGGCFLMMVMMMRGMGGMGSGRGHDEQHHDPPEQAHLRSLPHRHPRQRRG